VVVLFLGSKSGQNPPVLINSPWRGGGEGLALTSVHPVLPPAKGRQEVEASQLKPAVGARDSGVAGSLRANKTAILGK
jgi:hypothetical protein